MSNFNQLFGVDPVLRKQEDGHFSHATLKDIDSVLVVGRMVRIEGMSVTTMHVVAVDRARRLVAIMEDGHSTHMNSIEGSLYSTSENKVYKYLERIVGNQVHVILPYSPLFKFPLREGAGF